MDETYKQRIKDTIDILNRFRFESQFTQSVDEIEKAILNLQKIISYDNSKENCESNIYVYELFNFVRYKEGYAIAKYIGFEEDEITIPDTYFNRPVVAILENSFKNCNELKTIILGQNISAINQNAFSGCKNLKTVVVNNKLSFIGHRAFSGCTALKEFNLPDSVKLIESWAFSDTGLTTIKLPPKITVVSSRMFDSCKNLRQIVLNESIKSIEDSCFSDCENLEYINLPQTLENIGNYAFLNCVNLKELKVSSINVNIGNNVFCKSFIVKPDNRYKPRIWYKILINLEIKCIPGSTIQDYCRKNNIKCTRLTEFDSKKYYAVKNMLKIGFPLKYIEEYKKYGYVYLYKGNDAILINEETAPSLNEYVKKVNGYAVIPEEPNGKIYIVLCAYDDDSSCINTINAEEGKVHLVEAKCYNEDGCHDGTMTGIMMDDKGIRCLPYKDVRKLISLINKQQFHTSLIDV